MTPYLVIDNFNIGSDILQELADQDWKKLEVASVFRRKDWLAHSFRRGIFQQSLCFYGLLLQRVGTLLSCKLPQDLEHRIRVQMQPTEHDWLCDHAIMRLQIVYDGSIIPIHTDINREAGIVYPVQHHSDCSTVFYNVDAEWQRGMMPPYTCQRLGSVDIHTQPALLDVTIPHSINYPAGTYTKRKPRISLSFKFKSLDFSAACQMLR